VRGNVSGPITARAMYVHRVNGIRDPCRFPVRTDDANETGRWVSTRTVRNACLRNQLGQKRAFRDRAKCRSRDVVCPPSRPPLVSTTGRARSISSATYVRNARGLVSGIKRRTHSNRLSHTSRTDGRAYCNLAHNDVMRFVST